MEALHIAPFFLFFGVILRLFDEPYEGGFETSLASFNREDRVTVQKNILLYCAM